MRAYNIIALVDLCCTILEEFYVRKFREFTNFNNARLFYALMLKRSEYNKEGNTVRLNEYTFIVPSKSSNPTYTVHSDICVCTCASGQFDRFYKHEAAVHKYYDIQSSNFPPVTSKCRYQMAVLATGDTTLSESYYEPMIPLHHDITNNNGADQRGFLLQDQPEIDRRVMITKKMN